nr:MAG TPA: hypothetical protein [Caudoviricetes sp.]
MTLSTALTFRQNAGLVSNPKSSARVLRAT